jgi:hypothetical protein
MNKFFILPQKIGGLLILIASRMKALEDSYLLLLISKKSKEFAYTNLPKIERLFRIMTQKNHVALQRRMIDHLSKTAD